MFAERIRVLGGNNNSEIMPNVFCVYNNHPYETPLHTHDFFEMAYVVSGKGSHILNGEKMTIKKGDYFFINPGSLHRDALENDGEEKAERITIAFYPFFVLPSQKEFISLKDLLYHLSLFVDTKNEPAEGIGIFDPLTTYHHDDEGYVKQLFISSMNEFYHPGVGSATIIRNNIVNILITLMRKNSLITSNPTDDPFTLIYEYMKNNYMQHITLDDASKIAGYSPQYISKQFAEKTGGDNFKTTLKKIRIKNACNLLLTTNKTIAEIVGLVGYKDIKTFNAAFKEFTGTTPVQYKKSHKTKSSFSPIVFDDLKKR